MGRLWAIIAAKLNKLIGRAERPDEMLDYSYEQQTQMLTNVKRGIADVATAKKRIEIRVEEAKASVLKLETQARQALSSEREDLARVALERKAGAQQQLIDLSDQLTRLQAQQDQLVENERRLADKIKRFQTEKEVIKARYSAGKAQVMIGEEMAGISNQFASAGEMIGRAKDKTEQMEARAAGIQELVEAGTLDDITSDETSLDRELRELGQSSQIDEDLERLRQEIGAGTEQAAIGAAGEEDSKRS